MIRVIIADDEIRICKLIIKLIEWEKIGMLVVGTANNGIEALELIEKEKPDIVITDIRMPGYDGLHMIEKAKAINKDLEFIIISGYGQFEYAKRAIEYGVKDYLLKPINKEELHKTLLRVKDHIKKKSGHISLEKEYQLILKNDVNKVRESFLDNIILFNTEAYNGVALGEINKNYHFNFQEGVFCFIAFKIDFISKDYFNNLKNVSNNLVEVIHSTLHSICWEIETIKNKSNLYVLVNFRQGAQKTIEAGLYKILKSFNKRTSAFENFVITIGYGEEVQELKDIATSYEEAKLLIEDRILKGTGKIIKSDGIITDKSEVEDIFYDFTKKFIKALELLDIDEIKRVILNFKKGLAHKNIRGAELKVLIIEIGNIYYITMKKNNVKLDHTTKEQRKLANIIEDCMSIDSLFCELVEYITSSLTLYDHDKSQNNLKLISQAKMYIEKNYMNNITLEDLGTHICFNPSYFSSFFKKETGTSFIEYLSEVRIEKAKDLLKESGLRIQDICLMVGYSDVKYFTKSFIKHTGLKPNEYRKIFA